MNNQQNKDQALAAEYVLGTLQGAARRRFERQLAHSPALQREVGRWETLLSPLDDALTPVIPPAAVWQNIRRSTATPAARRVPLFSLLGWALAAALAGVVIWQPFNREAAISQPVAVLNAAQGNGQWVVSLTAGDKLLVQAVNIPPVGNANSLQLWLIPPGGSPQSLGLVDASKTTVVALNAQQLQARPTLAISLEPKGGSPGPLPSGPVLFSGQSHIL